MEEELFGGDLASKVRLGEATVCGILVPKYVTTVLKYQRDLDCWEKRVDRARAFDICDKAQKCLDALRRALERRSVWASFFGKHNTNKYGKCIIF